VLTLSLQELLALADSLDPSQLHALRHGLTSNVTLIQGPPGTGKTFVGALLCDVIKRCSSARILVVCYTNHALDQFLEYMEDKGIKEIVRWVLILISCTGHL
jgi:superfamily II DNA or RNA helicase